MWQLCTAACQRARAYSCHSRLELISSANTSRVNKPLWVSGWWHLWVCWRVTPGCSQCTVFFFHIQPAVPGANKRLSASHMATCQACVKILLAVFVCSVTSSCSSKAWRESTSMFLLLGFFMNGTIVLSLLLSLLWRGAEWKTNVRLLLGSSCFSGDEAEHWKMLQLQGEENPLQRFITSPELRGGTSGLIIPEGEKSCNKGRCIHSMSVFSLQQPSPGLWFYFLCQEELFWGMRRRINLAHCIRVSWRSNERKCYISNWQFCCPTS